MEFSEVHEGQYKSTLAFVMLSKMSAKMEIFVAYHINTLYNLINTLPMEVSLAPALFTSYVCVI